MARFNNADEIQFYRDNLKSESENNLDTEIVVGLGTCGIASGARDTLEAIKKELEWKNIKDIKNISDRLHGLLRRRATG